ncbi:Hypothetical predicted protein, partial [Marmota monax]
GRGRSARSMASNIYWVRQRISRLGQVRPEEEHPLPSPCPALAFSAALSVSAPALLLRLNCHRPAPRSPGPASEPGRPAPPAPPALPRRRAARVLPIPSSFAQPS